MFIASLRSGLFIVIGFTQLQMHNLNYEFLEKLGTKKYERDNKRDSKAKIWERTKMGKKNIKAYTKWNMYKKLKDIEMWKHSSGRNIFGIEIDMNSDGWCEKTTGFTAYEEQDVSVQKELAVSPKTGLRIWSRQYGGHGYW